MTQPVRLLVVDDHTLFRRGLVALLSQDERFAVVGEAGDSGEAQRRAAACAPDMILLDNHLPGVRGVDAIAGLKEVAPAARVLMLTVSENEEDLVAALQAGADGYLLKTINSEDLSDSICKVLAGESVVSPEMMGKLVAALRSRPAGAAEGSLEASGQGAQGATGTAEAPAVAGVQAQVPSDALALLSPREREILALIAAGLANKAIARDLGIAETTVKIHVQHILRKLKLSSRVQAAVFATSQGLTASMKLQ
ncbi:response regulator [Extensimonas sp. H3M7-6]|uniref:response regulator n=1 Tax=Extensimonas soli TaxID=3031322 RepID=UPI0023DCE627|nr:response regulator [Extensimonas sp. H3M7-6]MDF1482784.1 response regulator [Extensimonas sp. H3M7-6]